MAKPWPITDVSADEPLTTAVPKILAARFRETFSYEAATRAGETLEALHDMRVAARRLQAALRIFRDAFPRKRHRRVAREVRSLIRALGAVRERDVFIDFLDRRIVEAPEGGRDALRLLRAKEEARRRAERRALERELNRLRDSGLEQALRDLGESLSPGRP